MTEPPEYYWHRSTTYRVESPSSESPAIWRLNLKTGEFVRDNVSLLELEGAPQSSFSSRLSEEKFIQETERRRMRHLRGTGPIFALYKSIEPITSVNRRLTPQEVELIHSTWSQTFSMWEAEQLRRTAGEPPSFTVESDMQE
ncbi:MAG TPA: hypothetical protein VM677_03375 [Actinokineospora sp.]|jgi:hypothetical protein|nr:hypothetical protein [Actinokineospora sp.]